MTRANNITVSGERIIPEYIDTLEHRIVSYADSTKEFSEEDSASFARDIAELHKLGAGHIAVRALCNYAMHSEGAEIGYPPHFLQYLRNSDIRDDNFLEVVKRLDETGKEHQEAKPFVQENNNFLHKLMNKTLVPAFTLAQYPKNSLVMKSAQRLFNAVGFGSFVNRVSDKARMVSVDEIVKEAGEDAVFEHGFWNGLDLSDSP